MAALRLILIACFVARMVAPLAAQEPGIELKIGTTVLEIGETVDVQIVCTNTGLPGVPQAAAPDRTAALQGLSLKLLSTRPSSNSMTRIINGRRSTRTSYTYSMQVTALKEGTFNLGPISVEADGRTYQTRAVRIVVRNAEIASVPRGDRYVYVEMDVTPRSLYVTETYRATLTFGIRKVEFNGRVYELNLLRDVLEVRASQLSIFADGTANRSERWLADSSGRRHRYAVFRVTKQLRAEEVGDLQVGPVFLKLQYPTAIRRSRSFFSSGYEVTKRRRETARAEAITVQVKAPPPQGRPDDYTGAIGRFAMTVTAKPTRVEQGQPITLTISIRGNPLAGVAGPKLTVNPELASRFDYSPDELVGDIESGTKIFRRAIFPRQTGEQTVPAISWSFFDPRRERYVSLTSDPIDIAVEAAAAGSTSFNVLDASKPEVQHTALTLLTGGISPNFTDPDRVLADQSFTFTWPWIASLVVSPLAWLASTLTFRHRKRLRADAGYARRKRARAEAHRRITHALRNGEAGASLRGLASALTGYVADRYGLGTGTLTPAEVRSLLTENGLDQETANEIVEFLEVCDAAHYTPEATTRAAGFSPRGGPRRLEPAARLTATRVRHWIKRIERSSL